MAHILINFKTKLSRPLLRTYSAQAVKRFALTALSDSIACLKSEIT